VRLLSAVLTRGLSGKPSIWEHSASFDAHNTVINVETAYSVGSRIRVRLYNGKIVEAEITEITNQSTGRKLQIIYGTATASINPAQIIEVLP
jgi:hypothetical protein